jgi:hypothetical protein
MAILRQLRIYRLSVALIVQVIKVKSRNPDMLELRIFHDPGLGKKSPDSSSTSNPFRKTT